MPSPVGHALGGAIVGLVCDRGRPVTGSALVRLREVFTSRAVVASAVAGVLPDLDFLWGRHNMETHSLGAALLAGLAVWLWRAHRPGPACKSQMPGPRRPIDTYMSAPVIT